MSSLSNDEARLSADSEPSTSTSSSSIEETNNVPYSPRPRLFDNEILSTSTDRPLASDILSEKDYKQIRSMTFTRSFVPALGGAVFAAFYVPRIVGRWKPADGSVGGVGAYNAGKLRTGVFITVLTGMMTFLSYSTISSRVQQAREQALQQSLPRTPDGDIILPDKAVAVNHSPTAAPTTLGSEGSSERAGQEGLAESAGKSSDGKGGGGGGGGGKRQRYSKGKGLVGEVEEEVEMRDTWLRPGVPRREV